MSTTTPRIVWWILGVGLLARLMVIHWAVGLELILDEVNYLDYGRHLLEHGTLPDAFRPPLYPALIALSHRIAGDGATPIRLLQAGLSTVTGWVLFRWLRGHVGERGATLSTALWCLYPVLIGYTHLLWTETVFLSLLVLFLATALPAGELRIRRAGVAGVVFGLAALTRSVLVPVFWLAPLFVLLQPQAWRLRSRPKIRSLVFLGSFALTISPWVIHNQVVEGRLIVTETTNGYNLWKGNTDWAHPLATEGPQYPGPLVEIPMFPYEGSGPRITSLCENMHTEDTPFTRWHLSRCARSLAFTHIANAPLAFLRRGLTKVGHAFHPSNLLMRHLWLDLYGAWPPFMALSLIWGTAMSYLALLVLGVIGLKRAPNTPLSWLLAGMAMVQLAVIFTTFGNTRFRLPIMLVCMILAAWIPKRTD
jgi:hypothetical protein